MNRLLVKNLHGHANMGETMGESTMGVIISKEDNVVDEVTKQFSDNVERTIQRFKTIRVRGNKLGMQKKFEGNINKWQDVFDFLNAIFHGYTPAMSNLNLLETQRFYANLFPDDFISIKIEQKFTKDGDDKLTCVDINFHHITFADLLCLLKIFGDYRLGTSEIDRVILLPLEKQNNLYKFLFKTLQCYPNLTCANLLQKLTEYLIKPQLANVLPILALLGSSSKGTFQIPFLNILRYARFDFLLTSRIASFIVPEFKEACSLRFFIDYAEQKRIQCAPMKHSENEADHSVDTQVSGRQFSV